MDHHKIMVIDSKQKKNKHREKLTKEKIKSYWLKAIEIKKEYWDKLKEQLK